MFISKQIKISTYVMAIIIVLIVVFAWVNTTSDSQRIIKLERQINKNEIDKTTIKSELLTVSSKILNVRRDAMFIGFFFLAITLYVGFFLSRRLSSAIEELKTTATSIQQGNFNSKIQNKKRNEFGLISETFTDLAHRAEQAETIFALNEELKKKNDSLDSFVYRVSHDLKAPVLNIKSLLQLIKLKISTNESPEVKQSIFFLESSTDKLHQTIFDLLEVSRIERSLETSMEFNNLNQVITHIKNENSRSISDSNAEIICDFKIPEIYFSASNLSSVLTNLIANSIKYSSSHQSPIIHLTTERAKHFTCLKIKDNGLGIDLEKHGTKLFGMFNRFHNHVEGSGVGLYIVKKIMDGAGGKIEIESELGKGTTFSLFFPVKDSNNQKNTPAKFSHSEA